MFRVDRLAATELYPPLITTPLITTPKDRTNDDWVCQFSGAAGDRDEALGELRRILVPVWPTRSVSFHQTLLCCRTIAVMVGLLPGFSRLLPESR